MTFSGTMQALDSSRKSLAGWVWEELNDIEFSSFYEPFGGSGRVAQFFKRQGYQSFVSNVLQAHYWQAMALVQNSEAILTPGHFDAIVSCSDPSRFQLFSAWQDHYFTKDEAQNLSIWRENIENHSEFQDSTELKSMAFTAVYLTMSYWLNFNQMYLQPKPMSPDQVLKHYVQQLNQWVSDNQMPNMSYFTDAYDLAPDLPADIIWINPPAMSGFRDTNRKAELAECWTHRVTQINLMGLISNDAGLRLGQAFKNTDDYLHAYSDFLDRCQNSPTWVVAHSERQGIDLSELESMLADKRSIKKKVSMDIAYPLAQDTLIETETLLIAVAE